MAVLHAQSQAFSSPCPSSRGSSQTFHSVLFQLLAILGIIYGGVTLRLSCNLTQLLPQAEKIPDYPLPQAYDITKETGFKSMAQKKTTNIPKTIYMLWDSGWETAPGKSQLARRSWEFQNPSFEFIALNETMAERLTNREHYVPNDIWKNLTIQARSDIYRTILLHNYGGIWVDAMVVANMPLMNWLDLNETDLVTFSRDDNEEVQNKKGIHPWITSWFLAAPKQSYAVSKVLDVISNSTQMYRFTSEHYWWHGIVSELAAKNKRVGARTKTFLGSAPMHCKDWVPHFERIAPVLKRCSIGKLAAILETSRSCCGNYTSSSKQQVDVSSICRDWNCTVLGDNFRHWDVLVSLYGEDLPTTTSAHYDPAAAAAAAQEKK